MQTNTRTIVLVAVAFMLSCSKQSPTQPSNVPEQPSGTWRLSGTVRCNAGGAGIEHALVLILDGPNGGRSTTTDSNGRYEFADLRTGEFSVEAVDVEHEPATKAVTLAADATLDFDLVEIARTVAQELE